MKAMLGKLIPLALILLVALVVWRNMGPGQTGTEQTLKCPDLHKGCALTLDGRNVEIGVIGPLKPLEAFQVRVAAPGVARVGARFTMEGMDMGFNLYTLRADNTGVFQVKVTLPVCVTGRRDWVMHLDLDGVALAVPFVTEM